MKFERARTFPGGVLAHVTRKINELQKCLEKIRAMYPVFFVDENRSFAIGVQGYNAGSGGYEYRSYFRVIDASTYDASGNLTACKIGVTGGGDEATGNCGVVKVNGYIAVVAADTETITAAGTYRVWLHMWEDAVDGVSGEIIFNSQGVTTRPDNPNGGVAFSSQLVGDVTVTDNDGDLVVTDIVQHYLRGGEHVEYLWGDCVQGEVP